MKELPQAFKKGHIPWNKGKSGVYSPEHIKLISEIKKRNPIKRFSDYPDLRHEVSNGRTLCVPCHKTITFGHV